MIVAGTAKDRTRLQCIFASALVLAGTVLIAGLLTPGYRPFADAVSRLGSHDEPHAWMLRVGLVLYGSLIAVGARPLGAVAPARAQLVAMLIAGYGLAAVLAGIAPKDPPHAPHTLTSQIHVGATIVGGAALLAAMGLVARFASAPPARRAAGIVVSLSGVGVIVFPFTWGTPVYGLVEIFLLSASTLWLVAIARRALLALSRAVFRANGANVTRERSPR